MSNINETLKQKIDELDLDRRLNDYVDHAEQALRRAVGTAGDLAHEYRDDVDHVLDRISDSIDERTEGKYADKVDGVRLRIDRALARLAERRPDEDSQA